MSRRLFAYGDRAVLAELDSLDDVLELREGLEATRPPGIVDIVPAARTITVTLDPEVLPFEAVHAWLTDARPLPADASASQPITIDVDYAGEDLDAVARFLDTSVDEVIRLHTESRWRVAFCGFAPGFAYLVTDHDRLVVPRLESPRTSVPAGSVALAGEFSGVYPRSGPGGWQLIGTTNAVLFDPARDPAVLLRPGVEVRFRAARWSSRDRAAIRDPSAERARERGPSSEERAYRDQETSLPGLDTATGGLPRGTTPAIRILEPGPLTLVQDLGRPGNAAVGAARSGALDRGALRLANRLVGNPENAAGLEILVGGFTATVERPLWFAVTGAFGQVTLDEHNVEPDEAVHAEAGQTLRIGAAQRGLRSYLAIRGGIAANPVLGSRSRDILSEIGPDPLQAGDLLHVGGASTTQIPFVDTMTVSPPTEDTVTIRVVSGPREHWFTDAALRQFYDAEWTVTNQSNRTGIRLELVQDAAHPSQTAGNRLERSVTGELPSEAMVPGAIQVPPSGQPTVLLADHPTTGGYPVIAVVTDASLDAFAQLRPGQRVAFRHAR